MFTLDEMSGVFLFKTKTRRSTINALQRAF